jgi:hypothetical protein
MSIKTITLTTHFFCIGWKAKLDISDMNWQLLYIK